MMNKIIFSLLFLMTISSVYAQKIEYIKGKIGIAQLTSITTDNSGNKWIGTSKSGVTKYDNKKFTNFSRNEKIGYLVREVFADSKGRVWVSFSVPDGIACFTDSGIKFYTKNEIDIIPDFVSLITEDKNGNIWFAGSALIKYNGKSWSPILLPPGDYNIKAIDIYSDGTIALGSNEGLMIRKEGEWETYNEDNSDIAPGFVRAVKFNKAGDIYIGYSSYGGGGFSLFHRNGWKHYNDPDLPIYKHAVNDIEIDSNDRVWFATNKGLFYLEERILKQIPFEESKYNIVVHDITIEGNVIWLASNRGLIKISEMN